jgi:ParB family transcriptional regulator, chromosome partitioning protein
MTTTPSVARVDLDPRDLLVDVNIRTEARLDKDFVASIKDFGVLVPIIAVRTADGDVRVRFGHRRTLAAIEADLATVPVEIVSDETTDDAGQIERILTQHAENAHRAPLLQSDQLAVVEQLNAFGLSAAQIAKRTKIKRDTVNTAIAVTKSDLAKTATSRYNFLTLEQAAAVAEFDDDAEAVKALIVAAQQDHGFLHLVQRLRDGREERIAKQPIIDELAAAGVKIIDRPRWSDPAKPLEQLGTSDDPLTPEAHTSCDGHVAWIDEEWTKLGDNDNDDSSDDGEDGYELTYVAVYGCSDPVTYGHVEPTTTALRSSRNGSQISDQEAKAERQRVLRNNKAWRTAEAVRRDWLKTFVARKSAPKGAQRFIFSELATGGYQLSDAMQKRHRFGRELLGMIDDGALTATLKNAGDARAQMITLALVLGAHEADLGVHTWRSRNRAAAERYLSQISSWGYELSEIEQSVIKDGSDDE